MKNLKDFIIGKQNFLIKNKSVLKDYDHYEYHPETKEELEDIIIDLLKQDETDLNCIDVSNVKNMSFLFYDINCEVIVKDIDISEWDVSNVKWMNSMFYDCKEFNSDLSEWNVSKVISFYNMFFNCETFNSDLFKWDVSNVEFMGYMFKGCKNFNSDLSKWDVSKVEIMAHMFNGCRELDTDLSNWNVSNIKNMSGIFKDCDKLEKNNKIPEWYEIFNKQNISEHQNFLVNNKNVLKDYDEYDYHPKTFEELKEIIIELLKNGITDLNYIDISHIKKLNFLFKIVNNTVDVGNINISNWNTSNVTNMCGLFQDCKNFNSDLSNWDVSNVENMCTMFKHCENFNSDLSNWDVRNVNNAIEMFRGCKSLKTDLNNWELGTKYNPPMGIANSPLDAFIFLDCNKDIIPKWKTDEDS